VLNSYIHRADLEEAASEGSLLDVCIWLQAGEISGGYEMAEDNNDEVAVDRPRVLVTREGEFWLAICLENGLAVHSRNATEVLDKWVRAYQGTPMLQRFYKAEAAEMKPAPERYHELWDQRKGTYEKSFGTWTDVCHHSGFLYAEVLAAMA